jgi:heparinase II/III-like protein
MPLARHLRRLGHVDWDELRTRAGQEAAKRWDRIRCRLRVDLVGPLGREQAAGGRFFFAPAQVPQLMDVLRERFPEQARRIVDTAERLTERRFDLLGFESLVYGQDVDWHLDAVHRRRAPLKPWYKIRYLDFRQVGDHKITWELNRHQWLSTLAKACWLTGQEHFARELVALWYSWQRANPYPLGVNWASSLEVALRSLSWLWVHHLLGAWPGLPEQFASDLLRALALSGRHIERYLSTYFAPNTHLLGEGVALFFIGVLCPAIPAAGRWRERGWNIVLREAERQVRPDGMHFEQSTYYHVYAVDFLLHARILAERNGIAVPESLDHTIAQMLLALADLSQAGALPRFGDDDGGRVFDPLRNRPEDMADALATAAALYGRADFKAVAGGPREETLWLLGAEGIERFDAIRAKAQPAASVRLDASGVYAMTDAQPTPRQLFIDAGPLGALAGGHGHADALSVQLAVDGRMWLIDPGTGSYAPPDGERSAFRSTAAHNTLAIDGASQATPRGPFGWRRLPRARAEAWATGETLDLFIGSHDGYRPVTHRRTVVGLKAQFWAVRDVADGDGVRRVDAAWHLAPEFDNHAPIADGAILAGGPGRLAILTAGPGDWRPRVETAAWSPVYGRTEPALVLRAGAAARLPAEIFTLIVPLDTDDEVGTLRRLAPAAWCYATRRSAHYFFFADRGALQVNGWATDAMVAYCRLDDDIPRDVVLHGGRYLERDGAIVGGER